MSKKTKETRVSRGKPDFSFSCSSFVNPLFKLKQTMGRLKKPNMVKLRIASQPRELKRMAKVR